MVKLEMLRCFEAVARCGGLLAAAEALGRTPSAVSMTLKQFEESVGGALFDGARKSRLTPLGQQTYREAQRALEQFDRSVAAISGFARAEAGSVRLAATPSAATALLPRVVRRFVAEHPKVRVELRDMDSASVLREFQKERVDLGVASIAPTPGLERRKLLSDPFGALCAATDPLAQLTRVGWADLAARPFIGNVLCGAIHDPGFAPIRDGSLIWAPNTASLLALVKAGVGVTLLPSLAAPRDAPGLRFLPLADCSARRALYLVSPPPRMLAPAARAFHAEILACRSLPEFQFS